MSEPCDLNISEAISAMVGRRLSAVELLDSCFERLDRTEPDIHAWAVVDREGAHSAALSADARFAKKESPGNLQGIPVAVKDIYDMAGLPTRCGSLSRADAAPATADAISVAAVRSAGAILMGKTVTQEFAAGVVSPPARNAWDPERIPGGSSGGTGTAIAAGSALCGFGSDTGGSIRIPASVCGVAGFKPAYGSISTKGVFPLSWSLDTLGPLGRNVADCVAFYQAMRGQSFDAAEVTPASTLKGIRVGVSRHHFFERLEAEVATQTENAIDAFRQLGAEIVEADWTAAATARAAGFVINRGETASVHQMLMPEVGHLYGEELQLRIKSNSLLPAVGYTRALRAREVIKRSMVDYFRSNQLDVMVAPATPAVAPPADNLLLTFSDGSQEQVMTAYIRLTMPFNVTGQPVMSVPCGLQETGLPVGLQIAGIPGRETELFRVAGAFEQTDVGGPIRPPMAGVS